MRYVQAHVPDGTEAMQNTESSYRAQSPDGHPWWPIEHLVSYRKGIRKRAVRECPDSSNNQGAPRSERIVNPEPEVTGEFPVRKQEREQPLCLRPNRQSWLRALQCRSQAPTPHRYGPLVFYTLACRT